MKKIKFKSAEHKRQHMELQKSWDDLKLRHKAKPVREQSTDWVYSLSAPINRQAQKIQSLVTPGGNTAAKQPMMYTGDKIKGIGVMHKSNLVPIFTDDQAKDIASMRR